MLILSIGGQGDGKSIINTEMSYKAYFGKFDPVLRMPNPNRWKVDSNCALYFCGHPTSREVDKFDSNLVHVRATCKCPMAQPNGTMNPLSLIKHVRRDPSYLYGRLLFFTEFHRWADSQLSQQLTKQYKVSELLYSYLIDESRKRHFRLQLDSQGRMKIYNRIRDAIRYIIICNNYANNPESLIPALEYIVVYGLGSPRGPKWWRFRPSQTWVKFYGSLFNSWETPSRITQAELAYGTADEIISDMDSIIAASEEADKHSHVDKEDEGTELPKNFSQGNQELEALSE